MISVIVKIKILLKKLLLKKYKKSYRPEVRVRGNSINKTKLVKTN